MSADVLIAADAPTLDYALAYAGAGYRVLPVRGKIPLVEHGAHDATTDEEQIRDWWARWPDAGIGLTLEGLVVVDIDPRNGGDVDTLPHALPETCYARTGGGGWHYLYRTTNGTRYPGQLAAGVDVKSGAGSYIVVEPSVHASGERYVWMDESEPWSVTPADAPEWIARANGSPREPARHADGIAEGGRNAHLTSLAGTMRRRDMTPAAIEAALLAENAARCNPPLADAEVRAVAASVARYAPPVPAQSAADTAPEPLDIFREFAAPALAPDDFPPGLAEFATRIARAAGHDPGAYLMAGLGAAAGALSDEVRLLLDMRTSWFESGRVWILLIGASGTAKTPAIRAAMTPLFSLHRQLRAQHAQTCEALGDEDAAPPAPSLFATDATLEKLSEILAADARGIICCYEELDSWLGQHDCYRGGQGSRDRGEWLRLFDGGPHQVDRIKRGSYFVENWGASILAATTPAGLMRHAKDLPADGLIQRFLPVRVQPMVAPDHAVPELLIREARRDYEARMAEIHAMPAGVVRLSREAFRIFDARRSALRDEMQAVGGLSEPFAAHLAKHAGLLGRVALVMHALDGGGEDVSGATMARAERLLRRLMRHALTVYDMLAGAGAAGTLPLARGVGRAIVAGQFPTVTRNTLLQHCRAFRDAREAEREAALRFLEDAAWLTPVPDARLYAGRPATYGVSSAALSRFAEHGADLRRRRAVVREALYAD